MDAKSADKPKAFVKYAQKVIESREAGELSIQDAGYKICGAVFIDELDDVPELEEAVSIGCDLELPPQHRSSDDEQKSWSKLKKLVSDYEQGKRRGISFRVRITGEKRNDKGQVIAGMAGWVYVKLGRVLVQIGAEQVKKDVEALVQKVKSKPNDASFLNDVQKQIDGKEIDGYKIIAKALGHKRGDGHSEFHSTNAFCGYAGDEEMRHLYDLVGELTDEELKLLTEKVGIKFRPEDYDELTREDFEGVIDEADREDFYREYNKIKKARA